MTLSTCLVYNIWCPETFQIFEIQGYNPVSECDFCSVWSRFNFFVSSSTGASNARFDGNGLDQYDPLYLSGVYHLVS